MPSALMDLLEKVTDEATFVRFLTALRENSEATEHNCEQRYDDCLPADHFQSRSTTNYLRSIEDWAAGGDCGAGRHHGEPILRRVATMLYVGRYLRSEDRPR